MTDDLTPEAVELELEAVLLAQLVLEKVTGSAEGVADSRPEGRMA